MPDCKNCGAPAVGTRCEYCGTLLREEDLGLKKLDNYIPFALPSDFGSGYLNMDRFMTVKLREPGGDERRHRRRTAPPAK